MARRTLPQSTKDGILEGLRNGVKPTELATKYGVSVPTIYNFKNRALAATAPEASASR